jgi:hypothetical protein
MFIILKIKTPPPIGWRDLKPPPAGGGNSTVNVKYVYNKISK